MRAPAVIAKALLLGLIALVFLCPRILMAQPTTAGQSIGPSVSPISKTKGDARMIDLSIIAQLESSNNPKAFNWRTKATGTFQITPICLQDYNANHPHKEDRYTMNDMWDGRKNRVVAEWYFFERIPQLLKHFNLTVTPDRILAAYHAGIGNVVNNRIGMATHEYIQDYKDAERKKKQI